MAIFFLKVKIQYSKATSKYTMGYNSRIFQSFSCAELFRPLELIFWESCRTTFFCDYGSKSFGVCFAHLETENFTHSTNNCTQYISIGLKVRGDRALLHCIFTHWSKPGSKSGLPVILVWTPKHFCPSVIFLAEYAIKLTI